MKRLIILVFFFASIQAFAQVIPESGIYKVRMTVGEQHLVFEVKPINSNVSVESNRIYNWYASNQIRQTQGGFSGKLLNGQYQEFYFNKNLKEQGYFDKGLKQGIWKSWTEEGTLIQSTNWDNGIKQGGFVFYDEKGNLKQKGSYKNAQLNGKLYSYSTNGKVVITQYKNGQVVPEVPRGSFWSKINIFKKKKP